MNLYYVQDSDRPMWVVAIDWQDAVDKWKAKIREENEGECECDEPQGIQLVCDDDDLLIDNATIRQGDPPKSDVEAALEELRAMFPDQFFRVTFNQCAEVDEAGRIYFRDKWAGVSGLSDYPNAVDLTPEAAVEKVRRWKKEQEGKL